MNGDRPLGRRTRWTLLGLAAALTLWNAIKPLHIDDTFTAWVASWIAHSPLDPFGLEVFWIQWPQAAVENLTPPVLPYWIAIAVRLFGENELLWKLWLFPFCALLVFSLHRLLCRFGARLAFPFVALIVFAPTHFPALNLMQDIPAQALALTALAVYLRAHDRNSWRLALVAALLAALAAQTKYAQVVVVGVMLAHGLLFGRWRLSALVVFVSGGLFLFWEGLMGLVYGQGMLAGQIAMSVNWYRRDAMVMPLVQIVGATLPFIGLLCLQARGLPRGLLMPLGLATLAGFGALVVWPIEMPLFPVLGGLVIVAVALLAWHGMRYGTGREEEGALLGPRGDALLVCWIAGELLMYFAAAPFPATRRIMGLAVVCTLLAARHIGWTDLWARRTTVALLAASCLLGCLFGVVDLQEARAQRNGVLLAENAIRARDPQAKIWFVGHWGFQHHAERRGMRPVVPDTTLLDEGDWLLLPADVYRQDIRIEDRSLEHVDTVSLPSRLPLTTGGGYYGGFHPLSHRSGPRFEIAILQARQPFVARSDWSAQKLWEWTEMATGGTAAAALPALIESLKDPLADERMWAAKGLGNLGAAAEASVPHLLPLLEDKNKRVREASEAALQRIAPDQLTDTTK